MDAEDRAFDFTAQYSRASREGSYNINIKISYCLDRISCYNESQSSYAAT